MKFRFLLAFIVPLCVFCAFAQQKTASGLDAAAMNTTVEPCVDFYQYAGGNWIAKNPLPADRARWCRFTELSDHNEKVLLDILQGAAVVREQRSPLDQKIGDALTACMDTATINQRSTQPIKAELDRIRAMENMPDVVAELVRLHRVGIGVLFTFGPRPDAKDSTRTIAGLSQGDLSPPDREYYLKTDAKSVETHQRFVDHMKRMFQLTGDSKEDVSVQAQMVIEMETILAKAAMDRVSLRDPNKTYHILNKQEVAQLAPDFAWDQYFQATGAPPFETLNVSQPDYIKQIAVDLANSPIESWRSVANVFLHPRVSSKPRSGILQWRVSATWPCNRKIWTTRPQTLS